ILETPSLNRSDILNTKALSLGGQYFYEDMNIESLPKDNKTRKENIIEFFDLINIYALQKKELLAQLKLKWMHSTEKMTFSTGQIKTINNGHGIIYLKTAILYGLSITANQTTT
ncbi:hypothetical protein, partial [Aeromonas veronii]